MLADPEPPRGPRDLSTILWRRGRLALVLEPRNLLLGFHVAPDAIWAHLVPLLAIRWERRGPGLPGKAPDASGHPAEWMPGRWG